MIRKEISWYRSNLPLSNEDFSDSCMKFLPFKIPKSFVELLNISDGGSLDNSDFEYFDTDKRRVLGQTVSFIYGMKSKNYNFIKEHRDPPEFFPKDLVAFAETGNGDLICFDYRHDFLTDNPPIVYWNHEADIGKDVSYVAKDFEEFLSLLHEPDDDFELDQTSEN